MGKSLTKKIIESHYVSGSMKPGEEVFIKVDQSLTHDINAVMTYLAFEAIGLDRIGIDLSVSHLDHNLLYVDNKTPDDHIYLQSAAMRFGVHVSRPGNGICHTIQMSRFAVPGKVLMGGDSHTPHSAAVGMLCIGVGGMDVATAMTGVPMRITMPRIVKVQLTGKLRPGVNTKEVILEMLRRVTIKGGLGNVYEYVGPGTAEMEVPARATISNMGAELGATTSIFPADEQVRRFMKAQGREAEYIELLPDEDAKYDEVIDINLSELKPLIACPHQPDNVVPLKEAKKEKVQQVFIGSCTNTSYADVAKAALVLNGRTVHEDVSCTCAIASKQTYKHLLKDGYIDMLLDAGVRMLEFACGPCCAIGQTPATEGVAVRTSNRNFKGRAGNPTAKIYLVSPESAAATAITGTFATAEEILGDEIKRLGNICEPEEYFIDDGMIIKSLPEEEAKKVEIVRGPNIKFLPIPEPPQQHLCVPVSLKGGDDITTDDITPASAEFSSMRSNIPLMSQYCYLRYDPEFAARAKEMGGSIIIGGANYGQGSSREHAAINPMYLGVKAVIAKSIARIHKGNLLNHGILPMVFENPEDYDRLELNDELEIDGLPGQIPTRRVAVKDKTKGFTFIAKLELTDNEIEVAQSGGQLSYLKKQLADKIKK
ncbi:MAG: aconitate hydratase [Lachnospiraceae bacterium]